MNGDIPDADRPVYEQLKRIAAAQSLTTYSDIAPLVHLDMENPGDRDVIKQVLGRISRYEHHQGRAMLSAVVVHRQDNIPGEGFFELARELSLLRPGDDKLGFFCREVARVHAAWRATR